MDFSSNHTSKPRPIEVSASLGGVLQLATTGLTRVLRDILLREILNRRWVADSLRIYLTEVNRSITLRPYIWLGHLVHVDRVAKLSAYFFVVLVRHLSAWTHTFIWLAWSGPQYLLLHRLNLCNLFTHFCVYSICSVKHITRKNRHQRLNCFNSPVFFVIGWHSDRVLALKNCTDKIFATLSNLTSFQWRSVFRSLFVLLRIEWLREVCLLILQLGVRWRIFLQKF